MMAKEHHGYLTGVGRLRLHYRTWEVRRPVAGVVVIHGIGEHSGRYDELAHWLADARLSTFAVDLRGHGASEGRRGHVRGFDVMLQDVDRFRREVQGLVDPGTPRFLLGHSMGGLIALRYLEEYGGQFRGAIISSPWLGTAIPTPRWKVTIATFMDRFLPTFPLRTGLRTAYLTHDRGKVRDYEDDPRVHDRITPRLYTEMSGAMGKVTQRRDRLHIPLLFLLAGDDHIVETGKSRAFAESLDGDVTVDVVDDAYHEILNESERTITYARVRDWIMDRVDPTA